MLQSSHWEDEQEDPEEEHSDPHDDLDLEFMLYSQLHYDQADDIDVDERTLSFCAPQSCAILKNDKTENESRTRLSEHGGVLSNSEKKSPVQKTSTPLINSVKDVIHSGTLKKSGLKRSRVDISGSPRKAVHKKQDHSFHDTILIDSASLSDSSESEVMPRKLKRRETVMVEADSVLEHSTSIISISSDSSDSSETSLSGDADSESECSSTLETPYLQVHMDYKQGIQQSNKNEDKWKINEEDRLAAIVGSPSPSGKRFGGTGIGGRYYRPSSVKCFNCNEIGHLSKDCPKPQKSQICILCGFTGHFFRDCPQSLCYNCNQPGHTAKECSVRKQRRYQECHRCGMKGHSHQDCPDRWRQFHLTTSLSKPCPVQDESESVNHRRYCYNCSSRKHFGFECVKERIDRYSTATYPMVAKYDTWKFLKSFLIPVHSEKPMTLKAKRKLKKKQKEMERKNNVKSIKQTEVTVKANHMKKKPVKKKQKQKHNWDSNFSHFSDTGKPMKLSRTQRRKANQKQRKQGQSSGIDRKMNGFRLSSTVESAQMKMRR